VRTLTTLLILVGLATGDTVITKKEVIHCSVVEADTVYVRLKLPSGGVRMVATDDVYEVRLVDSTQVAAVAARLPGMRVVLDAGQAVPLGRALAEGMREASAQPTEPGAGPMTAVEAMSAPVPAKPRPFAGFTTLFSGALSTLSIESTTLIQLSASIIAFPVSCLGLGADISTVSVEDGYEQLRTTSFGPKVVLLFGRSSRVYLGAGIGMLRGGADQAGLSGSRVKFALGALMYAQDHIALPLEVGVMFDRLGDSYSSESMRTTFLGFGLAGLLY